MRQHEHHRHDSPDRYVRHALCDSHLRNHPGCFDALFANILLPDAEPTTIGLSDVWVWNEMDPPPDERDQVIASG